MLLLVVSRGAADEPSGKKQQLKPPGRDSADDSVEVGGLFYGPGPFDNVNAFYVMTTWRILPRDKINAFYLVTR